MIIELSEVPHSERHLLFCTALQPRRRSRRHRHTRRSKSHTKPVPLTDAQIDQASRLVAFAASLDAADPRVGAA